MNSVRRAVGPWHSPPQQPGRDRRRRKRSLPASLTYTLPTPCIVVQEKKALLFLDLVLVESFVYFMDVFILFFYLQAFVLSFCLEVLIDTPGGSIHATTFPLINTHLPGVRASRNAYCATTKEHP